MPNSYDSDYKKLISKILSDGAVKPDRTGTGTKSLFAQQLRIDMRQGFPLLTIKKTHFKSVLHELMWMLDMVPDQYKNDPLPDGRPAGCTNIKYLVDNGVKIWNEWPHKSYVQATGDDISVAEFADRVASEDDFAMKWGSLGPVYGRQWRYWDGGIDQFRTVADRIVNMPEDRRLLVNAWNASDVPGQALPPCHLMYQFWTAPLDDAAMEKYDGMHGKGRPTHWISLQFYMRSVDTVLGLPFDVASYAVQLEMMAKHANMVPLELVANLGDTHIYRNHINENLDEMLTREGMQLPKLVIDDFDNLDDLRYENIRVEGYESHGALQFRIAV